MRVIVFVDRVKLYGAERVAWSLAEGLSEKHQVTLVTFSRQAPKRLDGAPFGYRHIGWASRSHMAHALSTMWQLRRLARATRADVIVSFMSTANSMASGAMLGLSTKTVVTEHNAPSRASAMTNQQGRHRLQRMIFYRLADAVVTVSDAVRDDLAQFAWLERGRIVRIYNPLDYEHIEAESQKDIVVPEVSDGEEFRLLMVGRLKPAKGHEYAIRAMRLLPSNFTLYLAGDGDLESDLTQLAKDLGVARRVHFLGFQENPYNWMRWADVLLVPSLFEGFGLVVAEAAALGTPVVTSDDPALVEVAALTGATVVPRGDETALSWACRTLVQEGRPNAVRVQEFQAEHVVRRYSEKLMEVASRD